ncbi:hypothetical protein Rhopal_004240-T1 [Rhodotorula paludigena]|uniref:Major facilitator superfamily (MFS) profile domain-containing protein n=1 Tax=Rhodotorula paludigena TaxID=86838 RepID=A0AAV5GQC5_9BASI|nr:hypothetical protein Rhopal_004240-T1 [Rhodotorula paludigena]
MTATTASDKEESVSVQQQQHDSSGFTDADWELDRASVRRLDITVLPIAAIAYLLSFLDRSNLLLKKVGAHIMLPAMVTLWGICTSFVSSYSGLIVARLFLGLLEGGLFPGLVLFLSMFYRRHELQTRVSLFFGAASLSGAFSGLLAAALTNISTPNYPGWTWIFFVEGAFTFFFGIFMFFTLPRSPAHSIFLNAEQKAHVERRLKLDAPAGASNDFDNAFSWQHFRRACTSPHVLLLLVALFANGVTLYGFSYFTPVIVSTFGYTPVQTQLLTVPPFVCAFLITMINAVLSDRYGQRGLCTILMSFLALAGYIMFYESMATAVRYTSLFLAITGVYSTAPALVTWLPNNSAPHYTKATAVAFGFVMTNCGGIAVNSRATEVLIAMTCLIVVTCALNIVYLRRQNRKKAERREATGGVVDASTWNSEGDAHPHYIYTL